MALWPKPLDLLKNELRQAVLHPLASDPSSPSAGQVWFNTNDSVLRYFDGTDTIDLGASSLVAEDVQDIVGAMFSGNTETGVTVTYQDGDGTVDVEVDPEFIRDTIGTALVAGNNVDITVNDGADTITIDVETLTDADISNFAEAVSDQVGTMVTGNTETGITVTYQDTDNTLDFVVSPLDLLPTASGDVSLGGWQLKDVAAATDTNDAVTLGQLNSVASGIDWKASVRVATTTAGTLASDFENGDTVDGVTLATGDRILIKNQASGAENGIYVVAASGAPARAADANISSEVTGGMAVWVNEGTTNADTGWVLTTNDAITLDTTALVFTQFSGLGQVTAGSALTKTGNTLDVAVDSTTIEVSSDALRIAATAAGDGLTGGGGSALAVGEGTGISVTANAVALDTAVAVRKFAADIGNGSLTSFTVNHSLGTQDVTVAVYDNTTPFDEVYPTISHTDTDNVTVTFEGLTPTTDQFRVVVHG